MRSALVPVLLLVCAAPLAAQDTLKMPPPSRAPARDTAPAAAAEARDRPGLLRGAVDAMSRIRIRPPSEAAVAVPDVRGLGEADARASLVRSGFVLGAVDELPVAGRAPGTVVMQRPEPWTRLPRGSPVSVMLAAAPAAAAPVETRPAPPPGDDPEPPAQERPAVPPPSPAGAERPPVADAPTPFEPIAVLPSAQTDASGDAVAGSAPQLASSADPQPTVQPVASDVQAAPATTPPADAVVPASTPRTGFRWLPWLIAALALLAAAVTARRLRTRAAPTALRARTRGGAVPDVVLRGAPFGEARVRMRLRAGAPATTSSTSPFALR